MFSFCSAAVHWQGNSPTDVNFLQASPQSTSNEQNISLQQISPSVPLQKSPSGQWGTGQSAFSALQLFCSNSSRSNQFVVPQQQMPTVNSTPISSQVNTRNVIGVVTTSAVVNGVSFLPSSQLYSTANQTQRLSHILPANNVNPTFVMAQGPVMNNSVGRPVLLKHVGTALVPLAPSGTVNGQISTTLSAATPCQTNVTPCARIVNVQNSSNLLAPNPCQINNIVPYAGTVNGQISTNLPAANSCQTSNVTPPVPRQPSANGDVVNRSTDSPPLCTPYPSPLSSQNELPPATQRTSSTSVVQSSQGFQSNANSGINGTPVPTTINHNYYNQSFGFTHFNQRPRVQSDANVQR